MEALRYKGKGKIVPYKGHEIAILCAKPDDFKCGGADADIWCVHPGGVCPYAYIGIKRSHSDGGRDE